MSLQTEISSAPVARVSAGREFRLRLRVRLALAVGLDLGPVRWSWRRRPSRAPPVAPESA